MDPPCDVYGIISNMIFYCFIAFYPQKSWCIFVQSTLHRVRHVAAMLYALNKGPFEAFGHQRLYLHRSVCQELYTARSNGYICRVVPINSFQNHILCNRCNLNQKSQKILTHYWSPIIIKYCSSSLSHCMIEMSPRVMPFRFSHFHSTLSGLKLDVILAT